jgi:hypothetical protein
MLGYLKQLLIQDEYTMLKLKVMGTCQAEDVANFMRITVIRTMNTEV